MNAPVSAEECRGNQLKSAGTEKGVLFLDTTIFVVCLCVIALGALLSYILEQRHHARKKLEN